MEIWKAIDRYNGVYEISNCGNIKRAIGGQGTRTGFLLKKHFEWTGYEYVKLCYKSNVVHEKIHRLVAEAFLKKPNGKNIINHKNGNKADNRVENLEWCTSSENNLHAYRVLNKKKKACLNGAGSRKIQAFKDGKLVYEFPSSREAERVLSISYKSISNNLTARSKSAGGYVFKYKND